MAELQQKSGYDESTLARLERSLSLERLSPYMDLADGDRNYALALYEWNTKVSESLYGILQGFEVTLRNSINETLAAACGRPDWYDAIGLEQDEMDRVAEAKRRVEDDGHDLTPGRVVAELMFGFWTSLFGTIYAQHLWDQHLHKVFREKRISRKEIAKRAKKVRFLRNRVAHHESVIGKKGHERDLRKDVAEIIEATSWICTTTAMWITRNSTFDVNYSSRPRRPEAELPLANDAPILK